MDENQKFDKAVSIVKSFCPSFKTILKSQSRLHRAVGWLLGKLGNPAYISDFWTTIGYTMARPNICDSGAYDGEWKVVFHEGQHAKDAAKIGVLTFALLYLFPQIIGVLGVLYGLGLAIAVPCGAPASLLWGLFTLLALLPIPALGRAILEFRGYTVSLAVEYWSGGLKEPGREEIYLSFIEKQFTSGNYYYMMPFKKLVHWCFNGKLQELKTNTFGLDAYLAAVKMQSVNNSQSL